MCSHDQTRSQVWGKSPEEPSLAVRGAAVHVTLVLRLTLTPRPRSKAQILHAWLLSRPQLCALCETARHSPPAAGRRAPFLEGRGSP